MKFILMTAKNNGMSTMETANMIDCSIHKKRFF